MEVQLIENALEIRDKFINNFVLSWDEFQIKQKDWIAEMAKNKYAIDINWYKQAYLWDKLNFDFPVASFSDALSALKAHAGKVLIMSEDETLFDHSCKIFRVIKAAFIGGVFNRYST